MNIKELYYIYEKLDDYISNLNKPEIEAYLVYESGVLELYEKMLCGNATRKDFLIFAIKDMLGYLKDNCIDEPKSTLLTKFNRLYVKK